MKKQLFSVLVLSICLLPVLSVESGGIVNKKHPGTHQFVKNNKIYTDYYLGDTDNGADAAYAVYGTSCCTPPNTIVEVYQYSTGNSFSATGYTYTGTMGFSGRLTASNGYFWNGPLVQ
jgi:hypothetical protein